MGAAGRLPLAYRVAESLRVGGAGTCTHSSLAFVVKKGSEEGAGGRQHAVSGARTWDMVQPLGVAVRSRESSRSCVNQGSSANAGVREYAAVSFAGLAELAASPAEAETGQPLSTVLGHSKTSLPFMFLLFPLQPLLVSLEY